MRHDEFHIGLQFWCGGRQWRCTDVGSRVVGAICLEPHEVVTTSRPGGTTTTRTVADDESWLAEPPYAVAEDVFDEYSIKDCRHTEGDEDADKDPPIGPTSRRPGAPI